MAAHPPLRIFVFTTSFPRWEGDDAGIFVMRLVEAIGRLGCDITVFVPRDDQESPRLKLPECEIVRYRYSFSKGALAFGAGIMTNMRRNPALLRQAPGLLAGFLYSAIKEGRSHVVHANWLLTGIPAFMYSILLRVPFVVTARGGDVKLLRRRWARFLLGFALNRASAVVAVGNSVADELRTRLPSLRTKISVIPNGVEAVPVRERQKQAFRDERSLAKGIPYLTFIGSVIPGKRLEILIEAMAKAGGDEVLLIVGRLSDVEYVETLKAKIASHNLESRIRLEGVVPPADIPVLLAISTLYLTASEFEGRPNALLEAMAAGLPSIASDIAAHREIITHYKNGVLCSTDEDFAKEIRTLLSDAAKQAELGEAARRSVEHLSWRRSARAYRDLFASIHRARSEEEIDVPHRHSKPH